MTKYEYLFNKIQECKKLQREHVLDTKLRKFYRNARKGFEKRLNEMTVQEAEEEV